MLLKFKEKFLRKDLPEWWRPALSVSLILYLIILLEAHTHSWLTNIDGWLYNFSLFHLAPLHKYDTVVAFLVMLGQRFPVMVITGIYLFILFLKNRKIDAFINYSIGAILFVGSVGVVKYMTGRIGPLYTNNPVTLFAGGNIFPSGHTTGAVVFYGIAAIYSPIIYRSFMKKLAVVMSLIVGFGTVFLRTHWFSDVIEAYLNGIIVLLIAYAVTPFFRKLFLRKFARVKTYFKNLKKRSRND